MQSSTGARAIVLASQKPRVNAADDGYKPVRLYNTYYGGLKL